MRVLSDSELAWVVGVAALGVLLAGRKAFAYVGGNPVEIDLAPIGGGYSLRRDAAGAFLRMQAAAANDGVNLRPDSGFRSMEEQTKLFAAYKSGTGNLAATPGYSNHQSGIAVDIVVRGVFNSPEYLWLERNAGQFGFVNSGRFFSQPEPWHWEYRP